MPERERAVELYTTTDMSVEDIATELGTSRTTVYNWLQAAGVSGARRRPQTLAGPELERIAEGTDILLAGQRRVVDEIREYTDGLAGGLRDLLNEHFSTQNERAAVWSVSVAELRRDVDRLQTSLTNCESTLNNLSGIVDTLKGVIEAMVTARQQGPQLLNADDG